LSLWDYTGSGTKNIIRWSTNFAAETRMDPESTLAVAIRYTKGPYFAKTEIVINGGHSLNQNEADLRTTLTHELGHTMGLDHSDVGQAVMAPTLQAWFTGLHQDDVHGIQAAYSEMDHRQVTGYVSPLAYETEQESQPLSCGTVGPVTATSGVSFNGLLSLAGGLLISFVRKILGWFKSRK
ncbi:MAG: matrixin family metalloprotease, partial [Bdellovibrionales bacterium]|nr:matrixin family metalloprotease [Bdellovibrionales bacterium]